MCICHVNYIAQTVRMVGCFLLLFHGTDGDTFYSNGLPEGFRLTTSSQKCEEK